MKTTSKFTDYFKNNIASSIVKLYIMDDGVKVSGEYTRNPEYVDFSDKTEKNGVNKLLHISAVSQNSEGKVGTGMSYSKLSSITLDNSDNFFNSKFPTTVKTIAGNTANFYESKNGKQSVLYNKKCQLRLLISYEDGTSEESPLGTFLLGSYKRSNTSSKITLDLKDLSQPLRTKNSAEKVKDGLDWYQNKKIGFLVKQLLKTKYIDDTQYNKLDLPSNFSIPDVVEIPTAKTVLDTAGDKRALSSYGKAPDYDGDLDLDLNKNMVTRAMVYVPTTSRNLTPGLYLAMDNDTECEIWRFDRATEKYYCVKNGLSYWDAGVSIIQRLWYDSTRDVLIFTLNSKVQIDTYANPNVDTSFWRYDGNRVTRIASVSKVGKMFWGNYCMRDGFYSTDYSTPKMRIGSDSVFSTDDKNNYVYGENIPILFSQIMKSLEHCSISMSDTGELVSDFSTTLTVESKGIVSKILASVQAKILTLKSFFAGILPKEIVSETYVGASVSASEDTPLGVRFTFNQQGFCVYNEAHNCIVYAQAVSGALHHTYKLKVFYLNTLSVSTITENLYRPSYQTNEENGEFVDVQPISGCSGSGTFKDYVFFGGVSWTYGKVAGTVQDSISWVFKLDLNTNSFLAIFSGRAYLTNNTVPDDILKYSTPLHLAYDPLNSEYGLYMTSFTRSQLKGNDKFSILAINPLKQNIVTVPYGKRTFREQPIAATFDSAGIMYFSSGGQLYNLYSSNYSSVTKALRNRVTVLDNGWSAVDGEYYCSVHSLAIDEESRGNRVNAIVYGASSPSPAIYGILKETIAGKYFLWKYDRYLTDRIDLADFTGMSIWDVIEKLTMIPDFFAGFDVDGNFVMQAKTYGDESDIVINNVEEGNHKQLSATLSSNEDEVYNYVGITPYESLLQEPTADVTLTKRTSSDANEDLSKGTIIATYTKTDSKKVLLEALTDGRVSNNAIALRYKILGETFTTSLRMTANIGESNIFIKSGIEDIHKGDTVVITSILDSVEQTEELTVASNPNISDLNVGKVTFTSALTKKHMINSNVDVESVYTNWSTDNQNVIEDSFFDEWYSTNNSKTEKHGGTTYTYRTGELKKYQHTSRNVITQITNEPGMFVSSKQAVAIGLTRIIPPGGSGGIYQVIEKEKLKPNTYYNIRVWVRTSDGDTTNFTRSSFKLELKKYNASNDYSTMSDYTVGGFTTQTLEHSTYRFSLVSGTFKTGGQSSDFCAPEDLAVGLICIKYAKAPNRDCTLAVDSLAVTENLGTDVDIISIGQKDYSYPIGSTGVSINFQAGEPEFIWKRGDQILINCNGLKLEAVDNSVVTSQDVISISKYGQREFPSVKNEFVNKRMADQLSVRIIEDYKNPKYGVELEMPIAPFLNFLSDSGDIYTLELVDRKLFPESGGWSERFYIKSITHDVNKMTTKLQLRAISNI